MAEIQATRSRVLAFRLRAQRLETRLPAGALAAAAYGGLQDSAPRSGVLSLHARVHDVQPGTWEHPALVQIWGPRGAVYLIPAQAFPVFTLGRLPRDPEARARLESVALAAATRLHDGPRFPGDVAADIPGLQREIDLRPAAAAGLFRIRWDARLTTLLAVPPPDLDPEIARLLLARRFVRWFGPIGVEAFTAWAGIAPVEAQQTWANLEPELIPVRLEGSAPRWVHTADELALQTAEPATGVRLLPADDPFLKLDRDLLVPDPELRRRLFPVPGRGSPPYIPGGLLVDGELAGTWARQGRRVTFHPWRNLDAESRAAAEAEAAAFPIDPLNQRVRLLWHDPGGA